MRFPKIGGLALALSLSLAVLLAARDARADGPAPATTTAAPAPPPKRASLTILHTNDWHGYALPIVPKRPPKNYAGPTGGLVAAAALVERVKAEVGADRLLVLDAGDLLTGFPAATIAEDGVIGAAFIRAWSAVGYDAWAIGNHDFDAGLKNAQAIVALATPVCLVANLRRAEDGAQALPKTWPYKIFERAGMKVAVIGFTAPDLARLSSAETMAGLKALSLVEAGRPLVEKLRSEVDLIVAITHAGIEGDRAFAKAVPGIDVIVGGHSHTRLTAPVEEGATVIVQAGSNGRDMGRLDLIVEDRKVISHKGLLIAPTAVDVTPTAAMAEPLAKILKLQATLESEVIGETTQALTRGGYHMEQPIGSFIADSLKLAAGADVGLVNSGGVRADFDRGPVTRAELLRCLPNDDKLSTFEVSGADLEKIVLHNARAAARKAHGILQVGGVRYRWKKTGTEEKPDAEILKLEVNGKPLDREKTYVVATTVFIASEQAPKYLSVEPKNRKTLDIGTHAALILAFKEGPVEAPDRFRIFEEREGSKKPKERKPKEGAPREPGEAPAGATRTAEPETEPAEPADVPEEPAPKEPAPAGAGGR